MVEGRSVELVPPLFKKKWFWVSAVLFLLFAIIWDIAFASFLLVKSLSSGQWSTTLLVLGFLYSVGIVYQSYIPKVDRKQVKWTGRLILVVIAFIVFPEYGFFKTLYFLATVFIFARFFKWITHMLVRKRKPINHAPFAS